MHGGKHMFLEGETGGDLERRCGVVCGLPCSIRVFFLSFWQDNRPTRACAARSAAPLERGWAIKGACAFHIYKRRPCRCPGAA